MTTYKAIGPVAYITTLEIAADHATGYYIINGTPRIINVNNSDYLGEEAGFSDHDAPEVSKQPGGRVALRFGYPIKACHACEVTGHEEREFVFAPTGKLTCVKPVMMSPRTR